MVWARKQRNCIWKRFPTGNLTITFLFQFFRRFLGLEVQKYKQKSKKYKNSWFRGKYFESRHRRSTCKYSTACYCVTLNTQQYRRVSHEPLLYPYHIQSVQALTPGDYPARINFCRGYLQQNVNPMFAALVLYTELLMKLLLWKMELQTFIIIMCGQMRIHTPLIRENPKNTLQIECMDRCTGRKLAWPSLLTTHAEW